ncbi:GGDEF domain-containing protein, partial [Pseudoalteromonas sp. CAL260-MNA-CIBAN-0059]
DERTFELQVTLRELEEKNRSLELLNTEDALTGIKNRRFFDKKLVMELRRSRREQTPLSIVMLDIDRFKNINDTYGHIIGDQVIKAVSDL